MANPGLGFRQVFSVLAEMSRHLLQPLVFTSLLAPVAPGEQTALVGNTSWMFLGAGLIIDPGTANAELVIPDTLTPNVSFKATFLNSHGANARVLGITFPIQSNLDPLFTVPEVLSYLSRAQNDFLARVPSYFLLVNSTFPAGQIIQTTDCTPIMLVRVAASTRNIVSISLSRTAGVVTAITSSPHNLSVGSPFCILDPTGDPTFAGSFQVANVLNSSAFNYFQPGQPDSSAIGGTIGLLLRLYEVTQESLSQAHPNWQNRLITSPKSWFEDRVGVYQWGIDGRAATNFPVELLYAIRDVDLLGQMDGFLCPDIAIHIIKYRALQFCFRKDGEMRNSQLAKYCEMRFDRGVMAVQRWMAQVVNSPVSMGTTNPSRSRARA
jgi:hypothetical protein